MFDPKLVLSYGLIWGMILVGIVGYPILRKLSTLSDDEKEGRQYFFHSVMFLGVFAVVVLGVMDPLMWSAIGAEPFSWTLSYISDFRTYRPLMIAFWIAVVGMAVWMASFWAGASQQTSTQIDMKRKYFHVLVILLFVPGYLLDSGLLNLGLAVALAIFIMIEYVRCFRMYFVWNPIHKFFLPFLDERDQSGFVILSHMYLLIGCALPIWLSKYDVLTIAWYPIQHRKPFYVGPCH
jgi:dolichol kinase